MITFTLALFTLIAGYFVYGKFVEKVFRPDANRITPAYSKEDGVDYIPMPTWRIFMIQFLNIAGLGPIFGAIMGAKFGIASYFWIVFGCIFAGATHDYLAGMLSLRHNGESLSEIIGRYLGTTAKQAMRAFSVILLILVGAVFVSQPAKLMVSITPEWMDLTFWIIVIFAYYLLATMLPIDKIIGKIYPLFGAVLLFMAVGILSMLYIKHPAMPEFWQPDAMQNLSKDPIFPMMFISIACGAISGFHATQSPLMARCMKNEKLGRPIFFGAMITEGIVALIWAAAATVYFHKGPEFLAVKDAAVIVKDITVEWLGVFGSVIAILGVVAAPITSGDTALRSARLTVADFMGIEQKTIWKRIAVCLPIFGGAIAVLIFSYVNANGFQIIWRYFAWSNQTLSIFTLWTITVYLTMKNKPYIITLLPALLMTFVCTSFILLAKHNEGGLELSQDTAYLIGGAFTLLSVVYFWYWKMKQKQ
jgi:carbon starvation protein CstA